MAFYVYIIQSQQDNTLYKGFTENPLLRVIRHNNGESQYTSAKTPWSLVYVEELKTKAEALKREKVLKKYSRDQVAILLQSPKNIVQSFK